MNTFFIILSAAVLFGWIYWIRKSYESDDDEEMTTESVGQQPEYEPTGRPTADMRSTYTSRTAEEPETLTAMFNILNNLGCQPEKNDDGTLTVQYQGENFHMDFHPRFVRISDPWWSYIQADDPGLPRLREAVNVANFQFGPTVMMTPSNEDGLVGLHTRWDIMLYPSCPENNDYIRYVLDMFFETKDEVRKVFHNLNANQTNHKKPHNPVGFNINQSVPDDTVNQPDTKANLNQPDTVNA